MAHNDSDKQSTDEESDDSDDSAYYVPVGNAKKQGLS